MAPRVAGESHHYKELRRLAANPGGGHEGEAYANAVLVPEPRNKYDKNAVQVTVDGVTVG